MAAGKWIGGALGFITAGPLGALAGFALGYLFDKGLDSVNTPDRENGFFGNGNTGFDAGSFRSDNNYSRNSYGGNYSGGAYRNSGNSGNSGSYTRTQRTAEEQRNSFLFSLLVLSSYIIRADGKVMHSEMEYVRGFLRHNFGEAAVTQGNEILMKLFEQQKSLGMPTFRSIIQDSCRQIDANMMYAQRLQLLDYLVMVAKADGVVSPEEVQALREITAGLGLSPSELESMLNLSGGADNLEQAYKVLGIKPSATDDEVKAAYRQMALKNHPDRVASLGEDVRRAAEKKFQEINAAKETIYKARGIR